MGIIVFNIIWTLVISSAIASLPYSHRSRSPLCVKQNAFCNGDNSCQMLYIPVNSSICANLLFENDKTDLSDLALGNVQLKTYLYTDRAYSQTAFNITFSNITWTKLRFRISQVGNSNKNTCRQFIRTANSSTSVIAYDCLWSDERYEGKPFLFEYEAEADSVVESAKLAFTVPTVSFNDPKETWRLLTYVQTTRSFFGRSVFDVYWPKLPEEHGVVCYKVHLFSNDTGEESIIDSSDVCNCNGDLCKYETYMWFGSVSFGIQPMFSENIDNFVSKTQYFNLGGDTALPLLAALVICSIVFPIVLYLLVTLTNNLINRRSSAKPPTVLIIHSPTTAPHLHVIEALTNYLNTHCQVIAWMDELDIPNSESKDPFLWCAESIRKADLICVVASPYFGQIRSSSALYRTDRLLLQLLREQYASGRKTRYAVLMPSYTTSSDIPIEAASLSKIRIPDDLNTLLNLARNRWTLPLCVSGLPATLDTFTTQGRELAECLRLAADDLNENKQIYLAQVKEAKILNDSLINIKESTEIECKPKKEFTLSPTIFEERKKEYKIRAEDAFSHYPSNIENLNLLGDKDESLIDPTTKKTIANLDLDALDL